MANEFRVLGLKFQGGGIFKSASSTSITLRNAADSDYIDFTAGTITADDLLVLTTDPTAGSANDFDLLGRVNTGGSSGNVVKVTLGTGLSIDGSGNLNVSTSGLGHVIEATGSPLTQRANLDFAGGITAADNDPDTRVRLGGTLIQNTIVSGSTGTYSLTFNGLSGFIAQENGGLGLQINNTTVTLQGGSNTTINVSASGSAAMSYNSGALLFSLDSTGVQLDIGSDATGDIYYRNGSGVLTRLGVGSDADVLILSSGVPAWSSFTQGSVLFANSTGGLAQDNSNLFWDDTNNRLGIGLNSGISSPLHVRGASNTSGTVAVTMDNSDTNRIIAFRNDASIIWGSSGRIYMFPSANGLTSTISGDQFVFYHSGPSYGGDRYHFWGDLIQTTTAGTSSMLRVAFNAAPSSGTHNFTLLSLNPIVNQTGTSSGTVRGVYYNPTITAVLGTHIAFENTSGQIRLGAVTQDDTKTRILAIDDSTGQVFWRASSTLGSGGGVTSVGLTGISGFIAVGGSPITGSGTFTLSLSTQVANTVFSGPASGTQTTPGFRSLVTADLPNALFEDVTGTTYEFVEGDNRKWKRFTNAAGCTANIPTGLTTGWSTVTYLADGAGTLTYTSSGTIESTATTLSTTKTSVAIVNRGSDIHVLLGPLGTAGTGSVTSVALSTPSFLSVAGSPITSSGTLTVTLATQTANTVFAGPYTGADSAPTFRALQPVDLPRPVKDVTTTTYTVTDSDTGYRIYFTNVSGCTVTHSDTVTQGLWYTAIRNDGAGTTTFTISGAAVLNTPGDATTIDNEHGEVEWVYKGSNEWYGTGDFTAGGGAGSVTSVGLSNITSFATATGSPITSTGTLGYTLNTQSANLVFSGPASGSAAVPTFRALIPGDLPRLQKTVSATTYTIVDGDLGYTIYFTSSTGCVVTIDNTITVDSLDAMLVKTNSMTGGDLVISASSTTLRSIGGTLTVSEVGGSAIIQRVGSTTEWYVFGALGNSLSNSSLENELPRSNSDSDLISSGVFVTSSGNITMGSTSITGTTRSLIMSSSSTDTSLLVTPKGSGNFRVGTSTEYLGITQQLIQPISAGAVTLVIKGQNRSGTAQDVFIQGGDSTGSDYGGRVVISPGSGGLGDGTLWIDGTTTYLGRDGTVDAYLLGRGGISTSNDGVGVRVTGGDAYSTSGDGDGGTIAITSGQRRTAGAGNDGEVILDSREYITRINGDHVVFGQGTGGSDGGPYLVIAQRTSNLPSSSGANVVVYAQDSSDTTVTLALYLEQAVEAIGTFTPSHKLKVLINGTEYWLQLDAV